LIPLVLLLDGNLTGAATSVQSLFARLQRSVLEQAMAESSGRISACAWHPRACPFGLGELLAKEFTYDRAVERLYILLTSWPPKAEKDRER